MENKNNQSSGGDMPRFRIKSDNIRQAIETKYLGPTNFRGARVTARAWAGKITIPWDYSLNPDENHAKAAEVFARKFDWHTYNKFVGGSVFKGGYVFVAIPRKRKRIPRCRK